MHCMWTPFVPEQKGMPDSMIQSIKNKILAALASQIFAAIVILGLTSYTLMYELQSADELDRLDYVAQVNGHYLDTYLAQKQGVLERIALSDEVAPCNPQDQQQRLIQLFTRFSNEFPQLALVSTEGHEVAKVVNGQASEDLLSVSHTQAFEQAFTHANTPISVLPQGNITAQSVVTFAYHLQNHDNGSSTILMGEIPLQAISEQLFQFDKHKYGDTLFTNALGEILTHTDISKIGHVIPEAILHSPETPQSSSAQRMSFLDEDCFVAMSPGHKQGFTSLAVYPARVFMKAPLKMKEQAVIIFIICMSVAYVVSLVMASNLSRPIMLLSRMTQEIAKGNFNQRINVTTHDEVGMLEQSMNDMLEHLETSTTSIEALNQEIKHRQHAEERQAELLNHNEETHKELESFAHIVSHDLKAPLRGIQTIAGWLQEDYSDKLDETGKEQLEMLSRRVQRMKNLIDGILQYSRVGRAHETIKAVDLNATLPEVIDLLAAPDNMTITINKPLPTVNYETTRLAQIFQNLLSNAIKYIDKPEGKIHIDYTEDPDNWTFSISDNGPGIEEEHFDTIFGIFQTLNSRDECESTGIGLSIIKKNVEAVGGKIWLTSELGKGSTFSFTIPKVLALSPETSTQALPA